MLRRLWALTQKEFIQLIRDRRTLGMLLIGPAVELLIFAAAVHTDIKHISLVVADQSMSSASRSYLSAYTGSGSFDIVSVVSDQKEVISAIDGGQASIGLVIPPDFAKKAAGANATVLMLIDGSTSFTSQSAYNAANAISQQYAVSLTKQQVNPISAHLQILYNPDMKDFWFITPAFIAMLLQGLTMNLTSFVVAREREVGTIEALLVTPIRPIELMLAKTMPNLLIVSVTTFTMLLEGMVVLGVPFRGNFVQFIVVAAIAASCGLCLGLVASTLVQTQNQSLQLTSMVNITGMFLAGILFPVYSLPLILRALSYLFPATYFVPILRGMFLKGIGLEELWSQTLALVILLGISLFAASRFFRQSLE